MTRLRGDFGVVARVDRTDIVGVDDNEIHYSKAGFCKFSKSKPALSADLFAAMREHFLVASIVVRRAWPSQGVNTSLSGKLFFSVCWCIRDAVHFDSRVHAAIKPSHIGGQHGEESEEGEEGEERSEEDCEEDQEGREEEEVTSLLTRLPAA